MENEKVKYLTDMINDMDIKDKLRLAICIIQSKWYGLIYNTKENYEKFDIMLKDIDEEYRTTLINFGKYKLVMFAMAKLMEMETTDQNKVALYLFNIFYSTNLRCTRSPARVSGAGTDRCPVFVGQVANCIYARNLLY